MHRTWTQTQARRAPRGSALQPRLPPQGAAAQPRGRPAAPGSPGPALRAHRGPAPRRLRSPSPAPRPPGAPAARPRRLPGLTPGLQGAPAAPRPHPRGVSGRPQAAPSPSARVSVPSPAARSQGAPAAQLLRPPHRRATAHQRLGRARRYWRARRGIPWRGVVGLCRVFSGAQWGLAGLAARPSLHPLRALLRALRGARLQRARPRRGGRARRRRRPERRRARGWHGRARAAPPLAGAPAWHTPYPVSPHQSQPNTHHDSVQSGQEGVEVPAAGHLRAVAAAVTKRALPAHSILAGPLCSGRAWSPPPQQSRRALAFARARRHMQAHGQQGAASSTASRRQGAEHCGLARTRARAWPSCKLPAAASQQRPHASTFWTCKHNPCQALVHSREQTSGTAV
jgi:hypothetical protein